MEISRKIYQKIISLLQDKKMTAEDSLELADEICTLLENIPEESKLFKPGIYGGTYTVNPNDFIRQPFHPQYGGNINLADDKIQDYQNNKLIVISETKDKSSLDVLSNIEPTQTTPRKFKPFEKVHGGQVDGNGVFTPIPGGRGLGGVRDDNGKLVEL